MECLFCKIINKELPAEIIHEDEKILAFRDIYPKAKVHILIVPKQHVLAASFSESKIGKELIGEMFSAAGKIAETKLISQGGYRLVVNVGKDAGQTVEHLHLHLLGGEKLPWA
ncbi:MAG: histidine triad nucleotide-binding protein [bacterium]